MNAKMYGSVTVCDVSQATLRLAMAASELEEIDLAILRIDREIERQRIRKIALQEKRLSVVRAVASPFSASA